MSIARAFTTRRAKRPEISEPQNTTGMARAFSTRAPGKQSLTGHQISGPVALLSTTNMLSYNAPDIQGTPRIRHASTGSATDMPNIRTTSTSSSSSHRSIPESENGNTSPDTMTDASSVTDSGPPSPEPNHLSTYFQAPVKGLPRSRSTTSLHSKASHGKTLSVESVPSIPQRAPSHSKRAHQDMARKRSLNHHGSVPNFRDSKDSARAPAEVFARGSVEPNHPFGKELNQLMEVAEEFNGAVRNIELDEDYSFMQTRGLGRFDANTYMLEISGLYSTRFEDQIAVVEPAWI
ncbi:MAG: hypothetical protein Q9157_000956 [Trypethelium eluteriae]